MQTFLTTPTYLVFVYFFGWQMPWLGGVAATHVMHEFLLPDFDLSWRSPSNNYPYFGNMPTKRSEYIVVDARRVYLDYNSYLQKGLLKSFLIFVHSIPGVFESWLRIQVWRPVDLVSREKKFQLVWEHRVLVDMEVFKDGVVHQFIVNASRVAVETGDVIGWTFEDESNGPIGFDPLPGTKTFFRPLPSRDFPRLGLVYEFEAEAMTAAFSVAAEVLEHDVCSRCHHGVEPLKPLADEDENLPGGLSVNLTANSDLSKLKDPESPAGQNRTLNPSVIVGPVLGILALSLAVANVAIYVKLRQARNENIEADRQRQRISKRKESRKT